MASDSSSDFDPSGFIEQLISSRNSDLSFFLPFILGSSRRERSDSDSSELGPDQENPDQTRDRIVLINPLTQGMIVIEGSRSLEALFREMSNKQGPAPASKASIEAMPTVVITEEDGGDGECSICLDGWEIGVEAKEMPCKHRYHSGCIEKWLGIHGSCPVCRFKMPVEEEEEGKKTSGGGGGGGGEEERGRRGEIWVSFSFNGRRDSSSDSSANSSPSSRSDDNGSVVNNSDENRGVD